jgi:hypothetical protein
VGEAETVRSHAIIFGFHHHLGQLGSLLFLLSGREVDMAQARILSSFMRV